MRKQWDEIHMEFAHSIAERSTDPKHQVGCVIVSEDNAYVLAIGYNGDEKGGNNKRDSMEHGKSGFIHAEENALIKLNPRDPGVKVMYVTHSPCVLCAKKIINAGIAEVVYTKLYNNEGVDLLNKSGIPTNSLTVKMDTTGMQSNQRFATEDLLKVPSTSFSKEEIEKWKESFENNPNGLEHTLSRRFNGDSKTWDKTRADEFG